MQEEKTCISLAQEIEHTETIACVRQTAGNGVSVHCRRLNTGDTARQLEGTGAAVVCVTHAHGGGWHTRTK